MSKMQQLDDRLSHLESAFSQIGYSINNAVTSESVRKLRLQSTPQTVYGMQIALCVSTEDPLGDGRIRIYHPVFDSEYDPNMPNSLPNVDKLPWARPISPLGGFDDSGATWVPPAGSMVAIIYQGGNIEEPYYLGSIWNRHRGSNGEHLSYWYGFSVEEYFRLYENRRNGYNFGDNSGDQVHPPWNTDSYRQYDWDDSESFYALLEERNAATFPNHFGMKTVGKNWLKFVDGDPKCNYRGRRIELATARGSGLFLKDDHLTPFSQYGYSGSAPIQTCDNVFPCCETGSTPTPLQPGQQCDIPPQDSSCGSKTGTTSSTVDRSKSPNNPFQKRKEEIKYYTGMPTPQNNGVGLDQSGACLITPSGNFVRLDDSVDQPFGVPSWDLDFNFGCNDLYKGNITIGEATGAFIKLDGEESNPKIRSENNGIEISTAYGNYIKLSDHTDQAGESCECPPNIAGESRGIQFGTNSQHTFVMSDRGLKACGQSRKYDKVSQLASETGYSGYCMLRSGYGLQLLMSDSHIQTETDAQFILLNSPQKSNLERGPHALIMQEQKEGPGFLFLRSGGVLVQNSYDETLETVGDEANPASKFTSITDSYILQINGFYFNHSDTALIWADKAAYLIAGQDCTVPENAQDIMDDSNAAMVAASSGQQTPPKKVPCLAPALVASQPWICPMYGTVHWGITTLDSNGNILLDNRSDKVILSH